MSRPTSATDITNLALDLLSTSTISDVEMPGTDEIASTMNRWYDVVRQVCLEELPWNFAAKRDSIQLDSTSPSFGYSNRYLLPTDFISLRFIDDEKYPLSYWDYKIEGRFLLIDNNDAESLDIGYVRDEDDVTLFSASFVIYFAAKLAMFTAHKLTGDSTLYETMKDQFNTIMLEAKALNGKNSPPKTFMASKMLSGRRSYYYDSSSELTV